MEVESSQILENLLAQYKPHDNVYFLSQEMTIFIKFLHQKDDTKFQDSIARVLRLEGSSAGRDSNQDW